MLLIGTCEVKMLLKWITGCKVFAEDSGPIKMPENHIFLKQLQEDGAADSITWAGNNIHGRQH